jgi:hypothetical protein
MAVLHTPKSRRRPRILCGAMAAVPPPGLNTFRPSRKSLPRVFAVIGFGLIVGLAELTVGFASHGVIVLGGGIAFIAATCVGAVGVFVWRRNVALIAGPGWVGSSDVVGRRRYWPAAQIGRILEIPVIYGKSSPAPRNRVIFLSPADTRILTINPTAWDNGVLEKLYESAGRVPERRVRAVTAKQLQGEVPGALMWSERHINLLAVTAGAVVTALVLGSYALARALVGGG